MLPFVLLLAGGLVFLISGLIILYARWNYGTLEKLRIPVEPPTFLLGSCPDFYTKNPQYEDIRRFQEYGSVFGIYEGRSPQIFIADPDLLKLIFVKDYEHFSSRASIDLGHPISNEILDYLPEEKWKAVRSMMTPQLTSSRMKNMSPLTIQLADELATDLLTEFNGDKMKIDLRYRIIPLMINIAGSGLLGMEIGNRKDPNNSLIRLMKRILCEELTYDFRYTLVLQFPFLQKLFPSWPFPTDGLEPFRRIMVEFFKQRCGETSSSAPKGRNNNLGDVFVDMMNRVNTPEFRKLGIIPETPMSQILELFFTVYDSTGTALTMCVYHLAQHPDIQEKVLEEVDAALNETNGVLTFETTADLPYLTACLNESLRLAPPFIRPERQCTKEWIAYRDNAEPIKVPKGANILIPIWALHRHPKYFPDPETFKPERFLPENKNNLHPYAFAPFGHGNKNCIGQKFAYINIKLILCRLFKDFKFQMREDSTLKFKKGTRFVAQYAPIYLDLVKRY